MHLLCNSVNRVNPVWFYLHTTSFFFFFYLLQIPLQSFIHAWDRITKQLLRVWITVINIWSWMEMVLYPSAVLRIKSGSSLRHLLKDRNDTATWKLQCLLVAPAIYHLMKTELLWPVSVIHFHPREEKMQSCKSTLHKAIQDWKNYKSCGAVVHHKLFIYLFMPEW